MDRATIYTQEQGRSVDFLFAQRATMIGLGKLAQAAFGANTVVTGLAVTPNSPAALNVLVGIGEIYSVEQVDASAWGSLPDDTTDNIVKQGLNMASQQIATPAPSTAGYSVAYLIEAQYQDQDTNPVVLPFYNSANPQQPLNGQGGSGATLPTQRQGVCVIQAKAGIAAPTGTQVTPSVDSGWTALAVVTVANGQSSVTSGNIVIPAGVPQVSNLLSMMQSGSPIYAVDTSMTANTIALALTPPVSAYVDGEVVRFKAANNNNGPTQINWGAGLIALDSSQGALQGGEIVAGQPYVAIYSAALIAAVLIGQGGGAVPVGTATQSKHALTLGQAETMFFGKQQLITSSTTVTVPAGVTTMFATLIPGGGGGGGSGSSLASASTVAAAGGAGGGGAGTPLLKQAITVAPGQVLTATIGAAGSGGTGSTAIGTNATSGGAGGNTTLTGSSPTVNLSTTGGGGGGYGNNANASSTNVASAPGVAGSNAASYGGFAIAQAGLSFPGNGGQGASSLYGEGGGMILGAGNAVGVAGKAATGYGAGGGGASGSGNLNNASTFNGANGGAGTAGMILLEW